MPGTSSLTGAAFESYCRTGWGGSSGRPRLDRARTVATAGAEEALGSVAKTNGYAIKVGVYAAKPSNGASAATTLHFDHGFSLAHRVTDMMVTRGFWGRRPKPKNAHRIPPGQHEEFGFPVLSAGPTPRVSLTDWNFTLKAGVRPVKSWNWDEFNTLPKSEIVTDIHCVTTWTKLDTKWEGVLIDDLIKDAGLEAPAAYALAHSFDGYSTNVPLADLTAGKAMIALSYDGKPLEPDHGGPARLLVPHLYFWKSAKWVNGLQFIDKDTGGFWELRGYHMYGDPWKQQRFTND